MADEILFRPGMNLIAELPEGVVPDQMLLIRLEHAREIKGKALSEIEVLALMDVPSQAVH